MSIEIFNVLTSNEIKVVNFTITSTAAPGQEVASLSVPDLEAGEYRIFYAFQITLAAKDRPVHFGLTGDLADAAMFAISAGGNDELHKNRLYGYPFVWAGGPFTVGINFYKDGALGTTIIDFLDIVVGRSG